MAHLLRDGVFVCRILPRRDDLRLVRSGAQETLRDEIERELDAVEQMHHDGVPDLQAHNGMVSVIARS